MLPGRSEQPPRGKVPNMKFLVSYTHEKTATITADSLDDAATAAQAYIAKRAERFPYDVFKLVAVETFADDPEAVELERDLREAQTSQQRGDTRE
jgi:hypothetical protein